MQFMALSVTASFLCMVKISVLDRGLVYQVWNNCCFFFWHNFFSMVVTTWYLNIVIHLQETLTHEHFWPNWVDDLNMLWKTLNWGKKLDDCCFSGVNGSTACKSRLAVGVKIYIVNLVTFCTSVMGVSWVGFDVRIFQEFQHVEEGGYVFMAAVCLVTALKRKF